MPVPVSFSLVVSAFFAEIEHCWTGRTEDVAAREECIFVGVGEEDWDPVLGRSTRKGRQNQVARGETPRPVVVEREKDLGAICRMRMKRKAVGVGVSWRSSDEEAKQEREPGKV